MTMQNHNKFDSIAYLEKGTAEQRLVHQLLQEHGLIEKLSGYHPILTGTLPLNINIAESDLDVICNFNSKESFYKNLFHAFSAYPDFSIAEKTINGHHTVIAKFLIENWPVEIFGQQVLVKQQAAYRHMVVEHYLLQQHGETFRQQIVLLKQQGLKTEPAFAKLLNLQGNPYEAMLNFYPIVVETHL
jgi:hypothetical protein